MARGRSPAGHPLAEWVRVPWRMAGEGAPAWDGLARTAATEDVSDGEPKNSTPPASRTSQRVSGCSVIERYSKTPTIPSWSRLREGPAGVLGGPAGEPRASPSSSAGHGPGPGLPGPRRGLLAGVCVQTPRGQGEGHVPARQRVRSEGACTGPAARRAAGAAEQVCSPALAADHQAPVREVGSGNVRFQTL